jgi:hypothetical protein
MGLFKNKGQGLDKVLKFASKVTSGMPIVGAVVSAAEKLVPDEGFGSGKSDGSGAGVIGGLVGKGLLKNIGKGNNSSGGGITTNQMSTTKALGVPVEAGGSVTTSQWSSFNTWPMWAKIGAFAVPGGLILILLMPKKSKGRYGR